MSEKILLGVAVVVVLILQGVGFCAELLVLSVYATIQSATDAAVDGDAVIGTQAGQFASDFALPDLYGNIITLSQFQGQDILLVFGNTRCPQCAARIPLLNELDSESDEGGLKVIFIAMGSTPAVVREYINDKNIKFDVLLDTNHSVGRAYGVRKVPEVFIIDGDGLIQYSGPREGPAIWYILEGKEIPEAVLTAMETNDYEQFHQADHDCESGYAAIINDCEERAPYLIYQPTVVVKPNENFSIPVHVDFSDCRESKKNYYIDLDADGIYEVTGQIERDYFLLNGNFKTEGNHRVKGKVEGTYGTADFQIDVYVTNEERTPQQVRQQLYSGLYRKQSETVTAQSTSDGIRTRRVLLYLGSYDEWDWVNSNLLYHVLQDKYNFTNDEIILYTYDNNVPESLTDFDPNWIDDTYKVDGSYNLTLVEDTFQFLSNELDGDDLLFVSYMGHGAGYYGPKTKRPYWNSLIPDSIYEGPIDPYEYDDPDYREDEFQTEFIPSGMVNCLKYDLMPKAMNTFLPCFTYYASPIYAGDTIYRFKVVSHFQNLPLIDDSLASDNDIYLEKVISYARCDLNRNTIIEEDERGLCDWDGDGNFFMTPWHDEYDEDDWFDKFTVEENYHPYSRINGQYYCYFDKNFDSTIDMMGFESNTDPLYLDCLEGVADPNDLVVTSSDTDNNGYANYLDINLDGDLEDYLSFDESLAIGPGLYDDELAVLFSMIDPNTTKIFLNESCFSGGFVRDLSAKNNITFGSSEEDDTSLGYFVRYFFMALNQGCENFGAPSYSSGYDCSSIYYDLDAGEPLDIDNDGIISIAEAFLKADEMRLGSIPIFDDNADLNESYGEELTLIHELQRSVGNIVPEGIYADSIFLDPNFYGDINEVTCYDFDGPLNFSSLSETIYHGQYYTDYIEKTVAFIK